MTVKKSCFSKFILLWAWLLLQPAACAAAEDALADFVSGASEPAAEASAGDADNVAEPSRAEPPLVPSLGMEEQVSLDLRNTEVTDALKYLASKGGLNMSISKDVAGRVNLFLTDVPLRDVFDLALRSNELAYDKQGDIYNIMTEQEYRGLYGKRFSDLREVRSFRLKYAVPEQAFNTMDALKSEIGRLLVDEESGSVMVMDVPENLRQMEEALLNLEQQNTIRVFDLRYAKAKDVEDQLQAEIETKKLGSVTSDERTNQVVVRTLSDRMKDVEKIIEALDRKTREVLIDAKIIKVTLSDGADTGINWDSVFTNLKFHGVDTTNSFRATTSGTAPSEVPGVTKLHIPSFKEEKLGIDKVTGLGDLAFGTVARDGYELFRFLQTLGKTKVMSNPRLMVVENQEARIHVGTREAYVTTTTTTGQTTSTTAEEVQFIDVGIQFLVTPRISADGFVSMKLKPEISSVVRTLTTPSENEIPIVDTSTAETTVLVKDGATVIIGGLHRNDVSVSNKQVPYFGHVPLLGPAFFRQKNQDNSRAELVLFITPHIVAGDRFISGDEGQFGGSVKSYREYAPLLDSTPQPLSGPLPQLGRLNNDEE